MKFITQAAKVLQEQKKSKRRLAVFLCLAALVALGTVTALRMYGQAMSHKEKRLICQAEAHQHTDDCYDGDKLVCGQADYLVHTHNDDCYGADGSLVCHLAEIAVHTHTDECYTEEEVLVCTEEEQVHQHTDDCYTPERGDLQCQTEEHAHDEGCFDSETGELVCQLEEHQHDDNCYVWNEVLTCTAGGHQHSADCYIKEQGGLQCQIEEHTHDDACYDENGALICQMEEHTHEDTCYAWEDVLICQLEEGPAGHIHTDACYEKRKVPTCGQLELHTHGGSCYDENGELICELLELKEHTHQEECFETVELTDEEVAVKLEQQEMEEAFQEEDPENAPEDGTDSTSDDGAGTVSGDSVSNDEAGSVSGDSISGGGTGSVSGDSISGDKVATVSEDKVHIHKEKCYDKDGGLICGYVKEITKTCKRDNYIVTATYSENANIPEEAELIAEQITKADDAKHYAEREAEFQDTLKDDKAAMGALFKMGFYVKGEEIEPESPVVITVQFLDENGFNKGRPIKVVHFADKGSEVLEGDASEEGNATFEVSSFSEIALGTGSGYTEPDKDGKLKVYQSFEYDDGDSFHITFHFDGEVSLPQKNSATPEIEFGDEDVIKLSDPDVSRDSGSDDNNGEEPGETAAVNEPDVTDASGGDDELAVENGNITEEDREEDITEEVAGSEGSADEVGSDQAGSASSEQKLQFSAEPLEQSSEKYQAITQYVKEVESEGRELQLQALDYSLTYDGVELELENCDVKVEIMPTGKLAEQLEELAQGSQEENSIELVAVGVSQDAQVNELATLMLKKGSPENAMIAELDSNSDEGIAVYSAAVKDIEFTVQYYAYLETLATSPQSQGDVGTVELIDTSRGERAFNGSGDLPTNEKAQAGTLKTKNLYARKAEDGLYDLVYQKEFKEIFLKDVYSFGTHPKLENFNKFAKEGYNYDLKEIWVLKEGRDSTSTEQKDWDIYPKNGKKIEEIEFTNDSGSANEGRILITDKTVLRLVGERNTGSYNYSALFYDYDITDGKLYKNNTGTDEYKDRSINDTKTTVWAKTDKQGINSDGNYKKGAVDTNKYAFGNAAMGTGLEGAKLGSFNVNQANATVEGETHIYKKCSYGLVSNTLGSDGYPVFNVDAPNLFKPVGEGEEKVTGRTPVEGFSLDFIRNGDTYTLSSVNGTTGDHATGLERLQNGGKPWHMDDTAIMWQNRFWPMDDSTETYGTAGHDLKFGSKELESYRKRRPVEGKCYTSDDGQDHNSFFGMMYTVDFTLTKDYVGPLNYYFIGDDDMWVFLDDKLVCDIGGCHQSTGEYVDLWDWIEKPTENPSTPVTGPVDSDQEQGETHTLRFFYTERGASGSTCWMQFTLPSVSSKPIEYPNGSIKNTLKVGKTVSGDATDEEFEFTLNLTDADGVTPLYNTYNYQILETVVEADGTETEKEVRSGSIKHGEKFRLKNGQSIVVRNLPDGAKYSVQEAEYKDYVSEINGTVSANRTAEGNIDWDASESEEWSYINQSTYELPETGGPGPNYIVYAAVALLASSAALLKYRQIKRRREGIGR